MTEASLMFLAYLRGIETYSSLLEQLEKLLFLAYLRGIETIKAYGILQDVYVVFSLPKRD
ncbi:hypothetical protein CDSM653_02401 [Caldanaerobacter subterraneus subsp. pacificus DSM 12653]|uniref:Uncharacterized protein n=1 Tax=Caldanaerobacter subterraneus subsp. pacificus DSM 12653 TaxID=391606 RepID=A0A0F5PLC1_9THEO|nr:hypothetical protein CDSM653_02401 [Caldanaerobacter subterraneus subsp. pacificus DSM 12653]